MYAVNRIRTIKAIRDHIRKHILPENVTIRGMVLGGTAFIEIDQLKEIVDDCSSLKTLKALTDTFVEEFHPQCGKCRVVYRWDADDHSYSVTQDGQVYDEFGCIAGIMSPEVLAHVVALADKV